MIANTCPAIWVTSPYLQKAARLIFTAFNINSMPSRIATAFLRESTPNRPILKSNAAKTRYHESGTMYPLLFPIECNVDCTHQRCHQKHRSDFEWQNIAIW